MVPQPISVLIVETESGGHWEYAVTLARGLVGQGVAVRLATLFPYERLQGIEEVPVSVIGQRTQPPAGARRPWPHRRLLNHLEKLWGLVQAIREFQPDIVHTHVALGGLDFLYYRLVKQLGPHVVCTAHHLMRDTTDRMRFRAADLILVHSRNSIAGLKNYGIDESRIVQIPLVSPSNIGGNGIITRQEAKATLGLSVEAQVVLFFGHIAPYKGLDLLIDAHAKLIREHPNAYLVIAGEPIGDFRSYREQIVEAGLSTRVIQDLQYVPFDRVRVYFSAADVVALPYRWIYQSGVLQWAYAFGRPVVVTNVGGIREAVEADSTGVIVAPNADAIALAIHSLLSDDKLADAMGKRALLAARTKHSSEAVSERVIDTYRELMGCAPTGKTKRLLGMNGKGPGF